MTRLDIFVSRIRKERNNFEAHLSQTENIDLMDTLKYKIERINITLQDMGREVYIRKKSNKPKF